MATATAKQQELNWHSDPKGEWAKEVQNITAMKKSTGFENIPIEREPRVTHKEIKNIETSYNPILQKYNNVTHE